MCEKLICLIFKKERPHPPQVRSRKAAYAHKLSLQVAGQGFDDAFAPAVLLLALGDEAAQVLVKLNLLLVDLLQGAVLRLAHALLNGG